MRPVTANERYERRKKGQGTGHGPGIRMVVTSALVTEAGLAVSAAAFAVAKSRRRRQQQGHSDPYVEAAATAAPPFGVYKYKDPKQMNGFMRRSVHVIHLLH